MLNMKSETIPHDCSDCNHSYRQTGPIIFICYSMYACSYTCKSYSKHYPVKSRNDATMKLQTQLGQKLKVSHL